MITNNEKTNLNLSPNIKHRNQNKRLKIKTQNLQIKMETNIYCNKDD